MTVPQTPIHPLPPPRSGYYFAPESVFWRVNREQILLAGGPAALLLQVAHPLVGQGVYDHSDFRQRPVKRLINTLRILRGMIFGRQARADRDRARLLRSHARVHGVLTEGTPAFPVGTTYRAADPDLLAWVHTTLMYTALHTFETLVSPLLRSQRQAFVEDAHRLGRLLNIPAERLPIDPRALDRQLHAGFAQLHITAAAHEVIDGVLHPTRIGLPPALLPDIQLYATALLPASVRDLLELPWGASQARRWRHHVRRLRQGRAAVPGCLRYSPLAVTSELRQRRRGVTGRG